MLRRKFHSLRPPLPTHAEHACPSEQDPQQAPCTSVCFNTCLPEALHTKPPISYCTVADVDKLAVTWQNITVVVIARYMSWSMHHVDFL